jgi:phosphoglycerate dehydrogenase-like enzyme
MTRLAILDDYQKIALSMADWASLAPGVEVRAFHDTLSCEDEVAKRLSDFEIVVAMRERTPFPKSLLDKLPRLKLLVTTGRRNASIDVKAASGRGIIVAGTTMLPYPTAELAWGLILALARNLAYEAQAMRSGRWQSTVGVGLHGKVLGLLGLGNLGGQVAGFGKAFHMRVIAWSQNLTAEHAASLGVQRVEKEELFRQADFLSIHLVLSPRTTGLVGAAELALMKPTAYLVNTSRGPIVEESALMDALSHRRIAGGALDVYNQEPLPENHPFRHLENLLLTPHLGYVTLENYRDAYGQALEDVRAFLAGSPIRVLQP